METMQKRITLVFLSLMLLASVGLGADRIIPRDEFPSVNSEWNLTNTSMYFTDGEYFFVNGGNGRFYRLDEQLQLGREVFDGSVQGITQVHYVPEEHYLYFCADRANGKKGGLFRVKFIDGAAAGNVENVYVNGPVAHYDMDANFIYYNVQGNSGIYRMEKDGSNRVRISNHEMLSKNPAGRLHVVDGYVYYINEKDHCLWRVPCDAEDNKQAELYIERQMHSFVMARFQGKDVIIYVEFAQDTGRLDQAHLGVVDANGERVRALDHLRDVQSRYINYYGGYLYYIDYSSVDIKPYRVNMNDPEAPVEKIFIAAQHPYLDDRLGYIHVFDGWACFVGMTPTERHVNWRTGRSDIYNHAGDGIWFVNLETMESYKCWLPN